EGKKIIPHIGIVLIIVLLGFALLFIEVFVLGNNAYMGKILTGYGLFSLVIYKPTVRIQPFFTLGQKYLFPIYIGHPLVMHFVGFLANKTAIENNSIYLWTYPLIVMLVTIVISILVMYIIDAIKKKINS
ncbi:MAG: hypothetical protein ACI4GZ_01080, partial [Ruminococcus sp.]